MRLEAVDAEGVQRRFRLWMQQRLRVQGWHCGDQGALVSVGATMVQRRLLVQCRL